MEHMESWQLKWAYAVTILAAALPVGLGSSGWVAAAVGGGPLHSIPYLGPLFFLFLSLYRIYLVIRVRGTLNSYETVGVARFFRVIGLIALYAGAVIGVLSLLSVPLTRLLITRPSESGVEFFVVGVYLALLGGVGLLGIVSFEFSRLLAFERHARIGNA